MGIIKDTVRSLRKNQTKSESIFWEIVRKNRFHDLRFIRQYPIKYIFNNTSSFFVADFYCHKHKLIIEIDGSIHDQLKERDNIRDYITKHYGYNILRIESKSLLEDKDFVIKQVEDAVFPSIASAREGLGVG